MNNFPHSHQAQSHTTRAHNHECKDLAPLAPRLLRSTCVLDGRVLREQQRVGPSLEVQRLYNLHRRHTLAAKYSLAGETHVYHRIVFIVRTAL